MQLIPFTHVSESNIYILHVEREYNPVEIYNPKTIISIICFAYQAVLVKLKFERKYRLYGEHEKFKIRNLY